MAPQKRINLTNTLFLSIAGAKERCEAALREWEAAKVQLAAMKRRMIRRRNEAVVLWKLKAKSSRL